LPNPTTSEAIAAFLEQGGRVVKVPEPLRVTSSEVLEYLVSCGFKAKFSHRRSDMPYTFERKNVTLKKLVDVANRHRRERQLLPFATRG
jgi:hypothetical protein